MLPRTFDFGFATALSFKDVRLCVEEAEAMGVPMVVGSAVRQMLSITNQLYGPDSDFTAMAKVVGDLGGRRSRPRLKIHSIQETTMIKELFDKGLKIRKSVLGDAFVDKSIANADEFSMPMQELATEYCWGYIWGREGGLSNR